jgi:hypothetical protein
MSTVRVGCRVDGESAGGGGAGLVRVSGDDGPCVPIIRCRRRGVGRGCALGTGPAGSFRCKTGPRGGRLVRQPRLLPESLQANDIDAFLATLGTYRDRAIVSAMLLGRVAVGGGARPVVGRCGHGSAPAAGDR